MTPHGLPCDHTLPFNDPRETVDTTTPAKDLTNGTTSFYQANGYINVSELIPQSDLFEFQRAVSDVAWKLGKESGVNLPIADTPGALVKLERENPKTFFKLCQNVGGTVAGLKLTTSQKVLKYIELLTGPAYYRLFPTSPVLFWNHKGVERIQYDWHQKCSYFTGMPEGIHLWIPLFYDIGHENGPMIIASKPHKTKYPYSQTKKPGHVTQLIPHEDMGKYEHVECNVPLGGGVFFDHQTVHCTGKNLTDRPRLAVIIRYIDVLKAKEFQPMMTFGFKEVVAPLVTKMST